MTMLLNPQHALNASSYALSPASSAYPSSDLHRRFSVLSSLALSGSLLQVPGPIQSAPSTPRAPRGGLGGGGAGADSELVRDNPLFKSEDRTHGWKSFPQAAMSSDKEMLAPDPDSDLDGGATTRFARARVGRPASPPREDTSPKAEEAASNIEKIERRAKASIEKLRHILYTVKTRSPDYAGTPAGFYQFDEGQERAFREPDAQDAPQLLNYSGTHIPKGWPEPKERRSAAVDPTREDRDARGGADSLHEAFVHHDAVTCTRSTVKFNREANTAVVTLVATVRADAPGGDHPNERSVILAAQALACVCTALACVCTALEEKASGAISTAEKPSAPATEEDAAAATAAARGGCGGDGGGTLDPVALTEKEAEHIGVVERLQNCEVTEGFEVKKGYGATPFRPVYVVKLSQKDRSVLHALFKPFVPGDAHRYACASPEWVAYQLGLLLETDMVPPAVMRRDVRVGGKAFALGTLIHYVPDVRTLTRLGPQEWGAESSVYFVSNAHILDALVGTVPRERRLFMEGLHWVRHGKRRPMLLDHPVGPANGKLHAMWTPKINAKGVRKVSNQTLAALKGFDVRVLQEKLGAHISCDEMERILQRRDQVVNYFEAILKAGPALVV